MEPLILASGSPRRKELLARVNLPFETDVADVDEHCDLPARSAVEALSRRKALAVASRHAGRYVLGADTLVALGDEVLGKPKDAEEACAMLRRLSGETHQVYTGVTLVSPDGAVRTASDRSDVTFCPLSDAEISAYVESGEPLDKAGSYAMQGRASLWITHLDGSDTSVIGLPLYLVRRLLMESGYPLSPEL